jgi:hypothetical protein
VRRERPFAAESCRFNHTSTRAHLSSRRELPRRPCPTPRASRPRHALLHSATAEPSWRRPGARSSTTTSTPSCRR